MKLITAKNINFNAPFRGHTATPDSGSLARDTVKSSLILLLSIFIVGTFLFYQITILFRQTSSSITEWIILLAGIPAAIFLVLLSVSRFIRSMTQYRMASALDQAGVAHYGSIVDKWVDEVNGTIVHFVRYNYTVHVNAKQTVDRETYDKLSRKDIACILHLENMPHISRLELE